MSNDVKNLQRQNVDVEKKLARAQSGQNSRSMQEKTKEISGMMVVVILKQNSADLHKL